MKSLLGLLGFTAISITAAYFYFIPSEEKIKSCLTTTMFNVELCEKSKDYVRINQMSRLIPQAIVLTEDSNFYNHDGFEWEAIKKNLREGFKSGTFKKGGSTISQQLVKNMFLWGDRSFFRKGLEAMITKKVEETLTKKQILEKYLNIVEFGEGIYGVKAACRYYFKKHPSQVSAAEAAFLAMVLPNPVKYSRSFHRKELTRFAQKRLKKILWMMLKTHKISMTEYDVNLTRLDYMFSAAGPLDSDDSEFSLDDLELTEKLDAMNQVESQSLNEPITQELDKTAQEEVAPDSTEAADKEFQLDSESLDQ